MGDFCFIYEDLFKNLVKTGDFQDLNKNSSTVVHQHFKLLGQTMNHIHGNETQFMDVIWINAGQLKQYNMI